MTRWLLCRLCCVVFMVICASGVMLASAQDWTEFRGPGGSGHATATDLPVNWTKKNFKWQIDIPGRGWSSPVLFENEIWITTALETKPDSAEQAANTKSASKTDSVSFSRVQLSAICVDTESGSILRQVDLFDVESPPPIHTLNSFASPTCVIDGDFVYCNFGTMGTACVRRTDGEVIWKNQEQHFDHETGPGSSPIIWRGLLIVHCDGIDHQFVVAINKLTGKEIWRQTRTGEMNPKGIMKKAFSTPTVFTNDSGKEELLSAGADWLYSYDPGTGDELWKAPYGQLGFSNVPRPLVGKDKIYLCTGFVRSALLAFNYKGKTTINESDIAWRYDNQVPTVPSPILVNDMLFMVSDRGIATCLDANSGKEKWQQRLGGEFSASPIFADGHLYFGNRKGEVFVVKPSAEFELVATNQLDSAVMATPAASGEQLIVRTTDSLYCIQQSGSQ